MREPSVSWEIRRHPNGNIATTLILTFEHGVALQIDDPEGLQIVSSGVSDQSMIDVVTKEAERAREWGRFNATRIAALFAARPPALG